MRWPIVAIWSLRAHANMEGTHLLHLFFASSSCLKMFFNAWHKCLTLWLTHSRVLLTFAFKVGFKHCTRFRENFLAHVWNSARALVRGVAVCVCSSTFQRLCKCLAAAWFQTPIVAMWSLRAQICCNECTCTFSRCGCVCLHFKVPISRFQCLCKCLADVWIPMF